MSSAQYAVVVGCLAVFFVGLIGYFVHRHIERRWAMKVLVDFAKHFPGRCPICSYHSYGRHFGFTSEPRAPAHKCIEEGEP